MWSCSFYLSRRIDIETGEEKVPREEVQVNLAESMKEAVSHLQSMVGFIERDDRWAICFYKNLLALDAGKKNVAKVILDTTKDNEFFRAQQRQRIPEKLQQVRGGS